MIDTLASGLIVSLCMGLRQSARIVAAPEDHRATEEPAVIARSLPRQGLPTRAPPRSPVRPLALFEAA